jgi:hypothetical protein
LPFESKRCIESTFRRQAQMDLLLLIVGVLVVVGIVGGLVMDILERLR